MLLLTESEIRELTSPRMALDAARASFLALHAGGVSVPQTMTLDFPSHGGDAHVKGAHLHADRQWTLKVASAFGANPRRGLTTHSGLSLVFDAETGFPRAVLLDQGYLTELRTGAAGAIAAELLARPDAATVAVLGAGSQARFQLEALTLVRPLRAVHVHSRSPERARRYAADVSTRLALPVTTCETAAEAVAAADIVVTTTSAHEPVLRGAWLRPGTHVTAVGADMPEKRELDAEAVRRADLIAVDDLAQAATRGELHHARRDGAVNDGRVVTLGGLLAGAAPPRRHPDQITLADLTGVGAQDAAIAGELLRAARDAGRGRVLDLRCGAEAVGA